jgi:hypothetical protein
VSLDWPDISDFIQDAVQRNDFRIYVMMWHHFFAVEFFGYLSYCGPEFLGDR